MDESSRETGIAIARKAGLHYVTDHDPGISRNRVKGRFAYIDRRGVPIRDTGRLARIQSIAIPPAWTDVWICADPCGHIQATGRDARGRKQYRYHSRWREVTDETKFDHLLRFGSVLPTIRRRVQHDLARRGLPREKVLAAVVRLMERTLARVGNPEYARQNDSFGLTTLRNRHVHISRGKIELDFRAKSGGHHHSVVSDPKLARIVKRCRDLPGSELFQYLDNDGRRCRVDSADLNDYLREAAGVEVTAKDFRTWAATNLAFLALCAAKKPTKRGLSTAIACVAEQLRNTPAVCRKSYIHPAIIEAYLANELPPLSITGQQIRSRMWPVERELIRFLASRSRPQTDQHLGNGVPAGQRGMDHTLLRTKRYDLLQLT